MSTPMGAPPTMPPDEFLTRLARLATRLNDVVSVEDVSRAIIDEARAALDAYGGTVVVLDPAGAVVQRVIAEGYAKELVAHHGTFDLSSSNPLADAMRTNTPVMVSRDDIARRHGPKMRIGDRTEYLVALPLTTRGEVIGGFGLSFAHPVTLDGRAMDFVTALTQGCAYVLDRARLLESERQARAAAEEANEAKDAFLATLSHELRTPLNAMVGWAHLASRHLDKQPLVRQALETIERNADAQTRLISDLLDLSRITSGTLRLESGTVSLADIAASAVETVYPQAAAKSISIKTQVTADEGTVEGDGARLQQVLCNVLLNAIKFSPLNSEVHLAIDHVDSHARVRVEDSGIGIEPDVLPYIFDRFRQADAATVRKQGGLGLGLAIVRHIVEMHGGSVAAYSAGPGKGTTVTIKLPLVEGAAASPVHRPERAMGFPDRIAPLKDVAVLVVEDDPASREVLQVALEHAGARVTCAATAAAAREALASTAFDALLADIGLPGEDGYSLMRNVRSLEPAGCRLPSAALTAFVSVDDRKRALLAGFDVHLPKPLDPDEVIRAVSELVASQGR